MINQMDKKDKWFLDRHGMFTASEIGKLLSKGTGSNMFGAGALSYIRAKAIERMTDLWERPEMDSIKSILHGKMYEAPAFEMYKQSTKNYSMRYFGTDEPLFLQYDEDSGGSPDGIMGEGTKIHLGLELKCPKNSHIHLDYFSFKNQYDLMDYNTDYYAQIQFLLMITGADVFHFCSFDDRFKAPRMKIKVLDVLPDRKFQDNLEIRLRMAVKERDKIVDSFIS